VTQVLPGVAVFGLGLALTVAPLTAAVLGGVSEEHAGMGSAINNAVARVGGLLAIAALGAVVAGSFDAPGTPLAPPPAGASPELAAQVEQANVDAFHLAMLVTAALVAVGGVLSLLGIVNPVREVRCEDCPGGAAVGAPEDAGRALPRVRVPGYVRRAPA
jgi:hypothetical protein